MSAISTADILQDIRSARAEASQQIAAFAQASADYVGAKTAYEKAEAEAFIAAKAGKTSDELAKRMAYLQVAELKAEMDKALERKRSASLGSSTWGSIVETYAGLSHALNREIKLAMDGGPQ